jgi:prolyl-tRNA editing enzyme YbaK/EbsC (Cys-tRNA(Pro) deacylase)
VTGYRTGAVSPLGLPQQLPVFVDDSVTADEEISIGSGIRGTTIILRSSDLLTALVATLRDVQSGHFRA